MTDSDILRRLARLEAESAIRKLVARYCFTIDDRDLAGVESLFTPDAVVRSLDGAMNATGRQAIIDQYHGRYDVLGVSNHMTHDHTIDFDDADPDSATGQVSAHAELWRKGQMMVTALRYADRYRRTAQGWQFAERVLSFLYYVPLSEYGAILGATDRMRAYDGARPADYPEGLATWRNYRRPA